MQKTAVIDIIFYGATVAVKYIPHYPICLVALLPLDKNT